MKKSVPVAQYCNPAIGGQGHWDAHGLSAKDSRPRLWISACTISKDVDTLWGVRPGAHTCLYGDNSTYMSMSSRGVWLGPLVGCGFKPRRGLIQGVQTIVLSVVDLTPMRLPQQWYHRTKFTAGIQPRDNSVHCTRNGPNLYYQVNEEISHQHQRTQVWVQWGENISMQTLMPSTKCFK